VPPPQKLPFLGKRGSTEGPKPALRIRDYSGADFNKYLINLEIGRNKQTQNLKIKSSFKKKKK